MRFLIVLLGALAIAGASQADINGRSSINRRPPPLVPVQGLSDEWQVEFLEGEAEFTRSYNLDPVLGPFFNQHKCANCHFEANGWGGYPDKDVTFYGVSLTGTEGQSLFSPHQGLLHRRKAVQGVALEVLPSWPDLVSTDRKTPPLMGLGLVESVPDSVFHALAAENGGRVVVDPGSGRVQRWGSQNQVATLKEFVAQAFVNEMSITPDESTPLGPFVPAHTHRYDPNDRYSFIEPIVAHEPLFEGGHEPEAAAWIYMLLLDVPLPDPTPTAFEIAGGVIFEEIGCADCHTPTMTTSTEPLSVNGMVLDIPALQGKDIHPYSDFLLHYLGGLDPDDLEVEDSDPGGAIHMGQANPHEYRTPPLWGRRYTRTSDFHDGGTPRYPFVDTILRHGGEAEYSRALWEALSARDKNRVYRFLNTL